MAQTYSQNVVGYVNLGLVTNTTSSFNLIANQMDADGTGGNNNLFTVFGTNLPLNTTVYAWSSNSATFNSAAWSYSSKKGYYWAGDTNHVNAALQPGMAVFVATPSVFTNTQVGTVMQNSNYSIALTPGLEVAIAYPDPVAGDMVTNLNYKPNTNNTANTDTIYLWNPASQSFNTYQFSWTSKKSWHWTPSSPFLNVGQGLFIIPGQTTNWPINFVVK